MRHHLTWLCYLACCSPLQAQVIADFETTSGFDDFGRFSVALDHNFAPHATAMFIRLAEGQIPWVDDKGEVHQKPFYDGLSFSTVSNFEISSGSRTGTGNDNPGFVFQDDLRSPASPFSIYLDNDGPNTNGARFFISMTAGPHPVLRPGQYTRFGEVLNPTNPPGGNGRQIVSLISRSPSGLIHITSVSFRYLGDSAVGFRNRMNDPAQPAFQVLPTTSASQYTFRKFGGRTLLDWDQTSGSIAHLWESDDLRTWITPSLNLNVPGSIEFGRDITPDVSTHRQRYFRGLTTRYVDWPVAQRPLGGSVVQTQFIDSTLGAINIIFSFDASAREGSYDSSFGRGTFEVTDATTDSPFTVSMTFERTSGALLPYRLTLHHDLAWTAGLPFLQRPLLANPSRLDGINLTSPAAQITRGQWLYSRR